MNKFLEELEESIKETCFCDDEAVECPEKCLNKYNGISKLPKNTVVAMAYVPFQTCKDSYDAEKALSKGTLFRSLNKPFLGGKCI